jgi:hypothetical protein
MDQRGRQVCWHLHVEGGDLTGIEAQEKCPLCGAVVFRRLSVERTLLRLDAVPDPAGNVILIEIAGKTKAKVLCGPEMPAQDVAYKQHRCPSSGRPGPPCAVCRQPMDPAELFQLLRWTTHPGIGCDSEYHAEVARLRIRKAS